MVPSLAPTGSHDVAVCQISLALLTNTKGVKKICRKDLKIYGDLIADIMQVRHFKVQHYPYAEIS